MFLSFLAFCAFFCIFLCFLVFFIVFYGADVLQIVSIVRSMSVKNAARDDSSLGAWGVRKTTPIS